MWARCGFHGNNPLVSDTNHHGNEGQAENYESDFYSFMNRERQTVDLHVSVRFYVGDTSKKSIYFQM